MNTAFRTFFEQFTDLSARAKKHWPLSDPIKDSDPDSAIGYTFVSIITQKDVEDNRTLVDSFFSDLYQQQEDCLFSGRSELRTDEVKAQIVPRKQFVQITEEKGLFRVCTFLILGHLPGQEESVRTGCVGYYFPNSQTILLESIWMAKDLQGKDDFEISGLLRVFGDAQTIKRKKEDNQKTVLGWMLTYKNSQILQNRAALFTLIDSLQKASPDFQVKAVFHEALNPVTLSEENSMQIAAERLAAFHAIEARYLKFAYHHPAARANDADTNETTNQRQHSEKQSMGNDGPRNYYLLCFPPFLEISGDLKIDSSIVMKFVIDYGKFLHTPYKNYQSDLEACQEFKPGKQAVIKGFREGNHEDPISRNNTSIFENRLSATLIHLYLHHIPKLEQPRFIFRRSSVGFEIVVDEDYFEPIGLHPYHDMTPPTPKLTWLGRIWTVIRDEWNQPQQNDPVSLYCPVAHSGETDLFSYKYQADPPYFTRYYMDQRDVYVSFPSYFEFASEGRVEHFYRLPKPEPKQEEEGNDQEEIVKKQREESRKQREEVRRSIKRNDVLPSFMHTVRMNACVSYTYFRKSAVRVWHLVLKPGADDISELEIIKLMRFFSGSQEHEGEDERREIMRQIQFSLTDPLINSANKTNQQFSNETDQQFPNWKFLSKLANWFYWPPFKPNPNYQTHHEKIAQQWTWGLKTGGKFVFWAGAGLLTIWSWCWLLPNQFEVIRQWSSTDAETRNEWRTILYWSLGLLLLMGLWSWLFRGIGRALRDVYLLSMRKIRRIFVEEELPEKMPWLDPENPDNLIKLLWELTRVHYKQKDDRQIDKMDRADQAVSLRNVTSGVVEINTGNSISVPKGLNNNERKAFDDENFLGFSPLSTQLEREKHDKVRAKIKDLYKDLYNDEINMEDDPEPYSVEGYADYFFKSYCGICLGIFDYDRMGFQEIDDTLIPLPDSKTEESFMVIHRGVLAMLGNEDDVMNTFWNTLGINAYLLIPSAVLAHNDKVARDAERRLDLLLNDLRTGSSKLSIRELNEERNYIDDLLNNDVLGNVFQYKTEQELYRQGMERRGIDERIKDSRSKLEQLDKLISIKQEESNTRYQKRITYLATLVGIFSFYTVVREYFVGELGDGLEISKKSLRVTVDKIPPLFRVPLSWFSNEKTFNPLDLSHIAIACVFVGLIVYLLLSSLTDPNRNRKYFWQRNHSRSRTLPKTHAPSSKNRSSAK